MTRSRLLDAAGRVVSRLGSRKLAISDVATAAGVSRTTLYKYFPTKDDLLDGLASYEWEHFDAGLVAATAGLTPAEQLDRVLSYVVDYQSRLARPIVEGEPGFVLGRITKAQPHLQASVARFLGDCLPPEIGVRIGSDGVDDVADLIVRTAISHYLFPGDDAAQLFRELSVISGAAPKAPGRR